MALAADPSVISFAGGMPNPELLPTDLIARIVADMDRSTLQNALQYGPTPGYPPLIEALSHYLTEKGISLKNRSIIITQGGQQALDILARVFIDPDAPLLTETPAFIGALATFKAHGAALTGIPMDEEGMKEDLLAQNLSLLEPSLVYCNPCFQNPSGVLYSLRRKKRIASLITRYDCCLIEDDPYNELWFAEEDHPHTASMLQQVDGDAAICHVGSFSKIIGPGLRLGWLVGPERIIEKCSLAKQSMDACSSSLTQVCAHHFLEKGLLQEHVTSLRSAYAARARTMQGALCASMPEEVTWTRPRGGFYIWLTMPPRMDASKVFAYAVEKKCAFVIGSAFDPHGQNNHCIRLSFSHTPPEKIEKGVYILADAIRSFL
jgi:DNA-binding transcriptional MocR family regulator